MFKLRFKFKKEKNQIDQGKIALSRIFNYKKRLKIIALFCVVVLIFSALIVFIDRNPKKNQAANSCVGDVCTVGSVGGIPAEYEDKHVIINRFASVDAGAVRVWQESKDGHIKGQLCSDDTLKPMDYWSMDETSGTIVSNAREADWQDEDARLRQGDVGVTSAPIINSVDANHGKARNFSYPDGQWGSGGIQNMNNFTYPRRVSVGAWIWADTTTNGNAQWIYSNSHDYGDQGGFRLVLANTATPANSTIPVSFIFRTTNGGARTITSPPLQRQRWYHVMATYDDVDGAFLYIDGVQQASGYPGEGWLVYSNEDYLSNIGNRYGSNWNNFDGIIDDVIVFDYDITAQDVAKVKDLNAFMANRNDPNCDSKRHFKSLTTEDGAGIYHEELVPGDIITQDIDKDGSLADETTGTARWKKIDFEVDGAVTINSNIRADRMGYPGGYDTGWQCFESRAWGPGAGPGAYNTDSSCTGRDGGGGGYGGAGGRGDRGGTTGGAAYPTPFDDTTTAFEWGSGGGGAWDEGGENESRASGGAGGGRVRIKGHTITFQDRGSITARGYFSNDWEKGASDNRAAGGAGSGGTIWLIASSITFSTNRNDSLYNYSDMYMGGRGYGNLRGAIGTITILTQTINDPNRLFVYGGDAEKYNSGNTCIGGQCGGGGAGGRIFLTGVQGRTSVLKKLTPISRAGAGAVFNPYALQSGDTIKVEIFIGDEVRSPYTLSDNWLKTADGTRKCVPISTAGTYNIAPDGSFATDPLVWSNKDFTTYPSIYYRCQVN